MKKIIFFVLLVSISISCLRKGDNTNNLNLRFDWIPTMSFAGDIVAMNNFAEHEGIKLTLNPAGEGIDPIKMVLAEVDNIGIIGLDKLLLANEKGAQLIAIGIVDNITPTVFISKKDQNITSPYDLIGKRVGIQSGGATEFVYYSLLNKLKINRSKINEVQIGYDMKPFIDGKFDVRPGFIFDEVVFLEINNIDYNIIEPKDYGLHYPGRVYFVRKDFLSENHVLLQKFINAVANGWQYALNHPDSAINQLQSFEPKINYQREITGLIKAKDYFSGYNNQILMADTLSLMEMVENLYNLNIIATKPKISEFFDFRFVENFHEK